VSSPFFNLSRFLKQVDQYSKDVVHEILDTKNVSIPEWATPQTLDVLVSLTDNEFKYLPVFAGGQDDGTGAVFTDPVPEGVSGMVPIGPGPFFKTGYSAVGSSIGTDSESINGSEFTDSTYEGSAMVEDGHSGIFPRMRVMKDSDIASLALSDAGTETEGKGKGKAREMGPVLTPGTSVVGGSVGGEEATDVKNDAKNVDHDVNAMDQDFSEEGEIDDDDDKTVDNTQDTDHDMKEDDDSDDTMKDDDDSDWEYGDDEFLLE